MTTRDTRHEPPEIIFNFTTDSISTSDPTDTSGEYTDYPTDYPTDYSGEYTDYPTDYSEFEQEVLKQIYIENQINDNINKLKAELDILKSELAKTDEVSHYIWDAEENIRNKNWTEAIKCLLKANGIAQENSILLKTLSDVIEYVLSLKSR